MADGVAAALAGPGVFSKQRGFIPVCITRAQLVSKRADGLGRIPAGELRVSTAEPARGLAGGSIREHGRDCLSPRVNPTKETVHLGLSQRGRDEVTLLKVENSR